MELCLSILLYFISFCSISFHFVLLFFIILCLIIPFHIYLFSKSQVNCHNEKKKKNQVMIITLLWGFSVFWSHSTLLLVCLHATINLFLSDKSSHQIGKYDFMSLGDHFFYTECGGEGGVDGTRRGMSLKTLLWNVSIFTCFMTYPRPAKRSDNFVIEFPPLTFSPVFPS